MSEGLHQPPDGSTRAGSEPWPPRSEPWPAAPRPPLPPSPAPRRSRPPLLDEPPPHLAALAALVAAALVTLGAVVVALLATSDFGVPLGERLRASTTTLRPTVPLLVATALVLRGVDRAAGSELSARAVRTGAAVVACAAAVLLWGRLLADLLGAGAPGDLGVAAQVADVLVDLGALLLTVALAWWALRAPTEG